MPRAQRQKNKDAERAGSSTGTTGAGTTGAATTAAGAAAAARERMLDKTLEDSFPASDPPSTLPNPSGDPEKALVE